MKGLMWVVRPALTASPSAAKSTRPPWPASSAPGGSTLARAAAKDLREASAPHGPEGPVYPGTCRKADPLACLDYSHGASIRFRVEDTVRITLDDLRLGPQEFNLETLCGDFVIRRRDGLWAYQLACAVDDALMGVTHVWRGEDLLTSTPRQIALLRALGLPCPQYGHLPLVLDEQGRRMCKTRRLVLAAPAP